MKIQFPYGKSHLSYDFDHVNVLTSSIEEYDPQMTENALVAFCYMVVELLLRILVHPSLRARSLAVLGAGIGRNVRVYECRFVNLQDGFSGLRIGNDVHIGPDCLIDLKGPVAIGDGSVLAPRVVLLSHSDPGSAHGSPLCDRWPPEARGVRIGEGCWIGAGATILSGSVIGDRVVVGAAALVNGALGTDGTYVGIPARAIPRS